ncbi:MAG: dipeptidase [Deltaproteobacteria bacterium]|nr:dipeptidase [Deltaproteobacteria bacterium]
MSKNFLIVDAHEDIAFHLNYFKRDFANSSTPCMITLPWLQEGNVRMVFNTVFIHPKHKPDRIVQSGLDQLSKYEEIYKTFPDEVYQITKAQDLTKFGQGSKIGFLTLMEGADPIESVGKLDEFYERGVRIIGLAWNDKNQYASGNDTEDGLSQEGVRLIHRMNDLGITLDLSHLNEKCFWEAVELTNLIPIATHSNARAITDHKRNLSDKQLKAISERGGVIGIVLYNYFLKIGEKTPTLEEVFAHADYMVNLCGEDHVGIGSDMDGARIEDFPQGLKTVADLPKIAEYFCDKGYSEDRVEKIMSGNFLRVLKTNLKP